MQIDKMRTSHFLKELTHNQPSNLHIFCLFSYLLFQVTKALCGSWYAPFKPRTGKRGAIHRNCITMEENKSPVINAYENVSHDGPEKILHERDKTKTDFIIRPCSGRCNRWNVFLIEVLTLLAISYLNVLLGFDLMMMKLPFSLN